MKIFDLVVPVGIVSQVTLDSKSSKCVFESHKSASRC